MRTRATHRKKRHGAQQVVTSLRGVGRQATRVGFLVTGDVDNRSRRLQPEKTVGRHGCPLKLAKQCTPR